MNNETLTLAESLDAEVCTEESGSYEIVVKIDSRLDRDKYLIRTDKGKLYLIGGHDYSALAAVRQATKMISDAKENGTIINILSGYQKIWVCDSTLSDSIYNLTWSEEFDGDALNWRLWNIEETTSSGVNGKTSKTVAENVSVTDGSLKIKGSYDEENYYGGQVNTCGYLSYKYGYVEARMYIPEEAGLWSAFWARGLNTALGMSSFRFLEVDFFERFGKKYEAGMIKSSVLQWDYNSEATPSLTGGQLYKGNSGSLSSKNYTSSKTWASDVDAGWHTVGCDWTDTYMRFIVDGKVIYEFDYSTDNERVKSLMTSESLYLIFGMLAGSSSDSIDAPDLTTNWNEEFKVDWVHIYQKSGFELSIND